MSDHQWLAVLVLFAAGMLMGGTRALVWLLLLAVVVAAILRIMRMM